MKISASVTLAAVAATALFAGCGGGSNPPAAASVAPDPSGASIRSGPIQADRGRSWMTPSAAACIYDQVVPPCGLLYVSNYRNDDVLVYERDKQVGKLTGFSGPDGLCSDRAGDVWIVNNTGASIVEYAHGGTKVLNTLQDPGEYPVSCSVNPISGGLAVSNIYTTASGPGSVAIYHKATGAPLIITDPDLYFIFFCGYDAAGNLYIDGLTQGSGVFGFAELRRNEHKFRSISLDQTINYPGDVQWDGRHVVVGDQKYQNQTESAVYQTNGSGGKVLGTTVLDDAQDIVGFWVHSNNLIGPDANRDAVDLYHYPAGGKPGLRLYHFPDPYGVTVSVVAH